VNASIHVKAGDGQAGRPRRPGNRKMVCLNGQFLARIEQRTFSLEPQLIVFLTKKDAASKLNL
jgi:hypothetical protein